jgi:hypothetical protein
MWCFVTYLYTKTSSILHKSGNGGGPRATLPFGQRPDSVEHHFHGITSSFTTSSSSGTGVPSSVGTVDTTGRPTLQVCSPSESTPTFYFPKGRPLPAFDQCSVLGSFVSAHDYATGKLTLHNVHRNHQSGTFLDARTTMYQVGLHRSSISRKERFGHFHALVALTSNVRGHALRQWCRKHDVEPRYTVGGTGRAFPPLLGLFAVEHLAPPLRPEDSTGTMGTTALGTSNMLFPFDQSGDKLEVYDHLGQLVHSSLDGSGRHHGQRSSSFSPLSGPLSFFGQRDRLMVSCCEYVYEHYYEHLYEDFCEHYFEHCLQTLILTLILCTLLLRTLSLRTRFFSA